MQNILFMIVISGLIGTAFPFFFCSFWCFDTKPICAICSGSGSMMEFNSPCYMITYNSCYGTRYRTSNLGKCPILSSPKPSVIKAFSDSFTTAKIIETSESIAEKSREYTKPRRTKKTFEEMPNVAMMDASRPNAEESGNKEHKSSQQVTNDSWQDNDTTLQ